jgi:hypothetical protein
VELTQEEIEELDKKYAVLHPNNGKITLKDKKIDKFDGFRENESVSGEYADTFNVGW